MARTEKYFIGPALLSDIRRVVGRVDNEPIPSTITRIPTRLQDVPRGGGGGPGVKFGLWTATANWTVMPILSTAATNTNNTQVIRWAFPQATATQGTNTISYSAGETVLCVNHLTRISRLGTATSATASLLMTVLAVKEGEFWRLIGAEC
jgi:hypothetical protein